MTWYRASAAAVLCFLPSVLIAAAEPDAAQYVVQIQIAVAAGGVSFKTEAHHVTTDDGGDLTTVGEIDTMRVGELELDLDSASMWGGHDTPPDGSGVEVLSAPQIVIPAGTKGTVRSGSAVQYLERRDAECYTVHTLPREASPGIVLTLEANPAPAADDGGETATLDFTLRVSTISRREPVPGLDLDLGRPTINTKEVDSRLNARLGHWNLLTSHITRDPDAVEPETLLVLVRLIRPTG